MEQPLQGRGDLAGEALRRGIWATRSGHQGDVQEAVQSAAREEIVKMHSPGCLCSRW